MHFVANAARPQKKRFQPWRDLLDAGAIIGGGSDHMQKIGPRRARWLDQPVHPQQSLTRQQAIRMYTIDNAWLLFREKQIGSLEPGKLADFIVVDTDLLTCQPEQIEKTKVLRTYLAGKLVFERGHG